MPLARFHVELESIPMAYEAETWPLFPTAYERSNRPAAANRAEETLRAFVVAQWNVALRKTD